MTTLRVSACKEKRCIYVTFCDGNSARVSFDHGAKYESKEPLDKKQDAFMRSLKKVYDASEARHNDRSMKALKKIYDSNH